MSADVNTIRAAAKQMREKAQAATPGPWITHQPTGEVVHPETPQRLMFVAEADETDREHIAGMHPAVALAVADWLERSVRVRALGPGHAPFVPVEREALAVARAYLGT